MNCEFRDIKLVTRDDIKSCDVPTLELGICGNKHLYIL